jgi:two-component system sensor histidine kinase DctS
MRRIAQQAERAGRVVRSVNDFVRRRDRVRELVTPQALLDAIMPLVILQARKLVVRVQVDLDSRSGSVLCDSTMVEQVLLNLCRNGMQAMQAPHNDSAEVAEVTQAGRQVAPTPSPAERVLRLRVRPAAAAASGRWVEFSVTDSGLGISDAVAQQLFTPFFTTREEGMGLGLSLCRTVVEQHGGALVFAPNPPQGTVFTFTLPGEPLGATTTIAATPEPV